MKNENNIVMFKVEIFKSGELNNIVWRSYCLGESDVELFVESKKKLMGDSYSGYHAEAVALSQYTSYVINTGIDCIESIQQIRAEKALENFK